MKKIVVAVSLCGILAVGIPATAWAGTTYKGYDTTIGDRGGNGYAGDQTKKTSNDDGRISVTFVGNDYQIGAAIQKLNGSSEGTNKHDIAEGDAVDLPNSISKDAHTRLKVWGNPFWLVAIQTTGKWKSN